MSITKFSRQRELLLKNLRTRFDHPTAEQLHESLKGEVSLPTVYRNLARLCDEGQIIRINTDGAVRYDANAKEHSHFECVNCGAVIDIKKESGVLRGDMIEGCKIMGTKLLLYGNCSSCLNNK